MSHFYGTIRGKGTERTGQGTKDSGLRVVAASYQGSIEVHLHHTSKGEDKYSIAMRTHQGSQGFAGDIATGVIGMPPEIPGVLPTPTIESFTDEALAAEVKRRFNFELVLRQPNPPTR